MKPSVLIAVVTWLAGILLGAFASLIHPLSALGVAAGIGLIGGMFVRRIEEREESEARYERVLRAAQERERHGQAQYIDYPHEQAEAAGDRRDSEAARRVER